jgi:hypothetical protein
MKRLHRIPEEKIRYVKEKAGTMSLVELSLELGLSKTSIQKCASIAGVSLESKGLKEKRERLDTMIREKHTTMLAAEMAKELGVNVCYIYNRASAIGIDVTRKNKKPTVKEAVESEFFEVGKQNWLTGWRD